MEPPVRVNDVLAPDFLDGLADWPVDQVRQTRARCVRLGDGLSYVRRLVQARLDVVRAEQARRAGGGAAGDLSSLVDHLADTLSDHLRAPGVGRLPERIEPPEEVEGMLVGLDAIVAEDSLAELPEASDADLRVLVTRLEILEREVSDTRRAVFACVDALLEELTRRYRTGAASVDDLLR